MRLVDEYVRDVRGALVARKESSAPPCAKLVGVVVACILAYIVASIVLVPGDRVPEFNFIDERGAITALSAILMGAGGGFAFALFLITPGPIGRQRLFWLAMTAALGFLALDELLAFHERVGHRLDQIQVLRKIVEFTPVRAWNDLIVILYGVCAVPFGLLFLPAVLRPPRVFELLCVAVLCYAVHTGIDSVVEPPTFASVVAEESAKLLCSTFLALAMLLGLVGETRRAPGDGLAPA